MLKKMTKKQKKMFRRISISIGFYAVGMIMRHLMKNEWYSLIPLFIAYINVGYEVLLRAAKNISRGQVFDENFLMALATIGAIGTKEYPEAAAVMIFYQVGELFESVAVEHSRQSISSLMALYPDEANLLVDGKVEVVMPEEVCIGQHILVRPGERIPLDGIVVDGESMIDTSMLTGEPVPRKVKKGETALSGCVNQTGTITVEVTKEFQDSTVAKILELVESASDKKAKYENFITRFAKYYTPVVVIGACILAVVPPLVLQTFDFWNWIHRALIFLVVSCPCALVISVPLSFFGGIGAASRQGILVKGSNYLELLAHATTFVFDKTGTLTKGSFHVLGIYEEQGIDKEEVLKFAAYGEMDSNHPIALSIKETYKKELERSFVSDYHEVAGYGIEAMVEGKKVFVGNRKLMEKNNIPYTERNEVGTIVYVAVDNKFYGSIVIGDEIKEDAKETIQSLNELSCHTVMLTGDLREIGEKVGTDLGIKEIVTELLPADKTEQVERLLSQMGETDKLSFVGDGINDAPVLARADVGIAMGGLGSDAAIEAADVVIMDDKPSKIVVARRIAKKTVRIVKQNIVIALGVKGLVLLLATCGYANMWMAVFADVGVSVIAILNAMRLLRTK